MLSPPGKRRARAQQPAVRAPGESSLAACSLPAPRSLVGRATSPRPLPGSFSARDSTVAMLDRESAQAPGWLASWEV